MDIYPLFIEQSKVDFNKDLFDTSNNAYSLAYPNMTIQLNKPFHIVGLIMAEK